MAMKVQIMREPVIGMADGVMSTRTTIRTFIDDVVFTDTDIKILTDVLASYSGQNIEIVINRETTGCMDAEYPT